MHPARRLLAALSIAALCTLGACSDRLTGPDQTTVHAPQGRSRDEVPTDTTNRCTGQAGTSSGRC